MELLHANGVFARIHHELARIDIDFSGLVPGDFSPDILNQARRTWLHRLQTEFRSIQVMTRFMSEVLAAGDPLEIWAGAADAILDEIRHTALCMAVVERLGVVPELPKPVHQPENTAFLAQPMAQRALSTAISMLAISETLSVGFIEDLSERATHPVIQAVLHETLADEDTHHAFGWAYVEASLARFSGGMELWRMVTSQTLESHFQSETRALATMPQGERVLSAWPEPELCHAGLLSPQREALVFRNTYVRVLEPKLRGLELL